MDASWSKSWRIRTHCWSRCVKRLGRPVPSGPRGGCVYQHCNIFQYLVDKRGLCFIYLCHI